MLLKKAKSMCVIEKNRSMEKSFLYSCVCETLARGVSCFKQWFIHTKVQILRRCLFSFDSGLQ